MDFIGTRNRDHALNGISQSNGLYLLRLTLKTSAVYRITLITVLFWAMVAIKFLNIVGYS